MLNLLLYESPGLRLAWVLLLDGPFTAAASSSLPHMPSSLCLTLDTAGLFTVSGPDSHVHQCDALANPPTTPEAFPVNLFQPILILRPSCISLFNCNLYY